MHSDTHAPFLEATSDRTMEGIRRAFHAEWEREKEKERRARLEILKHIARYVCSGIKRMRHATQRCTPSSLFAWLARLQRRVTSRKIYLHATKGERVERFSFGWDRPATVRWGKKGEKKNEKKGETRRKRFFVGCETVRKVDRVTYKNDRAIDAHYELHTTSAFTSINMVLATYNYYRYMM